MKIASEFKDEMRDNGKAIEVRGKDVEEFLNFFRDVILWIKLPKPSDEYSKRPNTKYYFVLFGDDLMWSHKPEFGGHKLEVLTPTFN